MSKSVDIKGSDIIDNSIDVSKFNPEELRIVLINIIKTNPDFIDTVADLMIQDNNDFVEESIKSEEKLISNESALQTILSVEKKNISKKRSDLSSAKKRKKYQEGKISKIESDIESYNNSINDIRNKIPEVDSEIIMLGYEIQGLSDRYDLLFVDKSKKEKEYDNVCKQFDLLQSTLKELGEKRDSLHFQLISIEDDVIQKVESIKNKKTESESVIKEIDSVNEEIVSVQTDVTKSTAYKNSINEDMFVGNDRISQFFKKNDCQQGNGGLVEYIVEENTYFSENKFNANKLAKNDILQNGQDYANKNGVCNF